MLQHLFVRALPRMEASPHLPDLEEFATDLHATGYAWHTCRQHLRRLYRVLTAAASTPLTSLSDKGLQKFFDSWPAKGYVGTQRLFYRYLFARGRLTVSTDCEPRFALKQKHLQRLVDLRGLAPRTISYLDWALTDFLKEVLDPDDSPSCITAFTVSDFFRLRSPQLAKRTFHHSVCAVRSFLRYGYECGALKQELHKFELPQTFRFEQPPRALQWHQVEALLASIDRTTFVGNRDHAIYHLLAFYGLRPADVAALTLNSINWQAGTMHVSQSKTNTSLLLPLSPNTLDILHEHANVRRAISPHPQFFLCNQAPFGVLSSSVISGRFKLYARRSGLPIADASAYALRHTFAMRLLEGGLGIQAIGNLMGHKSMASTSAYLRIQSEMLRDVALDVPDQGGDQ